MDTRSHLLSFAAHGGARAGREARLCGGVRSRPQEGRPSGGGRRRSALAQLCQHRRPDRGRRRRRAAPLRLERLQLVPVPERAAPACRAALSGRARAALVQHPHPGHQARPQEAQAGAHDHGRGAGRARRLFAAAHRPLRARGHLRQRARQRRGQGAGRHLPDGPHHVRRARPLGDGPRRRRSSPTTSGGISATTPW